MNTAPVSRPVVSMSFFSLAGNNNPSRNDSSHPADRRAEVSPRLQQIKPGKPSNKRCISRQMLLLVHMYCLVVVDNLCVCCFRLPLRDRWLSPHLSLHLLSELLQLFDVYIIFLTIFYICNVLLYDIFFYILITRIDLIFISVNILCFCSTFLYNLQF